MLQDVQFEPQTGPALVTVFVVEHDDISVTEDWVRQRLNLFQSADDVFYSAFLQGVVFYGLKDDQGISTGALDLLTNTGMQWVHCLPPVASSSDLQPGPYILLDGRLRDVWRLHHDTNGAFFSTVQSDGEELAPHKS